MSPISSFAYLVLGGLVLAIVTYFEQGLSQAATENRLLRQAGKYAVNHRGELDHLLWPPTSCDVGRPRVKARLKLNSPEKCMSQEYRDRQKQLIHSVRADVSAVRAKASVVPIQADYAADGRRCLTSAPLPTQISAFLQTNIQQMLARAEPFHYYNPPESMHITIKNIRVAP